MKNSEVRLLELLSDETLFGLKETEAMELKQLKEEFPDWKDDISLELTAAAISLSNVSADSNMPANLRAKIFANAEQFFDSSKESQKSPAFASNVAQNGFSAKTATVVETVADAPKASFRQWFGWAFAAAACVALAINIWTTRNQKTPEVVKTPETIQTPTPQLTAAQEREQLIASASDAVKIPLADPKNKKEILGDMVWSNSQQKGFVRFRGLPINDAAKESYQLWIVDATRNEKTPVSGGVFDISGAGETIVPVHAQLRVNQPKAIAVTKEKAGGVVVSKQEKVVAVAKI